MAKRQNKVSDEAVLKATGKDWQAWFALIDGRGGKDMDHKEIVALLKEHSDPGGWWQQMVTVEYEKARGKRKEHEMTDGFQVSKGKTIPAPADAIFDAWLDENKRKKWLDDPGFTIRKATAPRTMRITWVDGKSDVNVRLTAKNEKTQISINHGKLADATRAEKMKSYWGKQLEQLAALF